MAIDVRVKCKTVGVSPRRCTADPRLLPSLGNPFKCHEEVTVAYL